MASRLTPSRLTTYTSPNRPIAPSRASRLTSHASRLEFSVNLLQKPLDLLKPLDDLQIPVNFLFADFQL